MFSFKNKNVLLDIFGQCSYYLVMLENAVKLRQCIKSKSGINNGRLEKREIGIRNPESRIGTGIGTGTGTGTGIRTVMERGTYIKIGTTIILTYFNLDLILI